MRLLFQASRLLLATTLTAYFALVSFSQTGYASDILVADFEEDTYAPWVVTGDAFGEKPARGTLPGQMHVSGYLGQGLVNSYVGGDGTTGTLTSTPFHIERDYISFLIGGGKDSERLAIQLRVDDQTVRTETGGNDRPGGSEELNLAFWDVREFKGKTAVIRIIDEATGGWGHINVDHIVQTDTKPNELQSDVSRDFLVEKKFLMIPIKNGGKKRVVELIHDDKTIVKNDIELADGTPDWWAPMDVSAWKGQTIRLSVAKLMEGSQGLESIKQSDEISGVQPNYEETLRGQFHFSPLRGWNNDPNGLVYYQGEYHLFFQHNPYGWGWGNMHWGHAVSKDLVHWEELGDKLFPDEMGPMFSGSAVVDWKNTSGLGKDGQPPMVLFYTAAGNPTVQGLAWSNDGRSFQKLDTNPILGEVTGGNRDPKVIWHEPSQKWVMVLYVALEGNLHTIHFYNSSDLKNWELTSVTKGGLDGDKYLYECPDLFPLRVDGVEGSEKWVLLGADGQYAIGAFDGKEFKPEHERLPGHLGKGFYAAQSFSDVPQSDGRRILVGWFQTETKGMPFNQSMTVPLELTLVSTPDGPRMAAKPVEELESLRESSSRIETERFTQNMKLPFSDFAGELLEVQFVATPTAGSILEIDLRGNIFKYDSDAQKLETNGLSVPVKLSNGRLTFHALCDRTGIELFMDNGLTYVPIPVNSESSNRTLSLKVTQGEFEDVTFEAWTLKSAWKKTSEVERASD